MATVQTTLRLPGELHEWIKDKASEGGVTWQDAVLAYLREAQRRDWSVTPQAKSQVIAE